MQNMGGVGAMMEKLPGAAEITQDMKDKVNDKALARQIAIIRSMTNQEKRYPDLIKGNRKNVLQRELGKNCRM